MVKKGSLDFAEAWACVSYFRLAGNVLQLCEVAKKNGVKRGFFLDFVKPQLYKGREWRENFVHNDGYSRSALYKIRVHRAFCTTFPDLAKLTIFTTNVSAGH
jgi:hypothetical protein